MFNIFSVQRAGQGCVVQQNAVTDRGRGFVVKNEDIPNLMPYLELSVRADGDVRATPKKTDPIYAQMVAKINASLVLETAKPATIYFVVELNEKIRYYKNTVEMRIARNKSKDASNVTSK